MEPYNDFDNDTNMNFDFLQFEEEDEHLHQDMSSITQVCVDHHGEEPPDTIDVLNTDSNDGHSSCGDERVHIDREDVKMEQAQPEVAEGGSQP